MIISTCFRWFTLTEERRDMVQCSFRIDHFFISVRSEDYSWKITYPHTPIDHFFPSLSPLQFIDLLLLVIFLILHLPQDLQKSLHLRLGLPSILFVLAHFLLQAGDAFGEFIAGQRLYGCTLSLEQKVIIQNKRRISFQNEVTAIIETVSSNSESFANNNSRVEGWIRYVWLKWETWQVMALLKDLCVMFT